MIQLTHKQLHDNLKQAARFYVNDGTITRSEKNRHFATPYFITVQNTLDGLKDWNAIKDVMKVGFRIRTRGRNPDRGIFTNGNESRGGRGGIHQDCPMKVATRFDVYMTPKKSLKVNLIRG